MWRLGREGAKIMQKIISGVAKGWGQGGKLRPVAARRGRQRNIVASGEGWHGGRQNPKKSNGAPSLSLRLLSSVAFGEGGGAPKSCKR